MTGPSMVPTPKQISRRLLGMMRSVDLVYSFRCYTTFVVIVDLLRHGTQYFGLITTRPRGNAALAAGCIVMLLSLALLRGLLGGHRLSLANVLQGRTTESWMLAFLFSTLIVADIVELAARRRAQSPVGDLQVQEGAIGIVLSVATQGCLRLAFVLLLWRAHRRRHVKVLP
mmetsp:Transcript_15743/g.42924  ORF Transcript_15743/g.42924 Transcript_15743/m.42924 type:complete len:171 (-) Transcript_15743:83-595(-)